jgi:DNA sulfur modification protein DndD
MILDSLVLDNFGAYGGVQEAILTPEPGKPVVLFGGMNGGGKTTLLDAVQLAFYGARARISNRGKQSYKDYLRDSIHRGADPSEGAGISIRFRRMMDGETRTFELNRSWRVGIKGIEETVRVRRDGEPDEMCTDHWDEVIDAYLPSGIAHLFFFDGEQIMELAEGGHAADILGTAIHSLLGLDMVDRLSADLKVFERRKRAEVLDEEGAAASDRLRAQLAQIDREQELSAMEEGQVVNQAGRLAKEVQASEAAFRAEGGDLYEQRTVLEGKLSSQKAEKASTESAFRALAAGPLPLLLLTMQLDEAERQIHRERQVHRAKALLDALGERDAEVLLALKKVDGISNSVLSAVAKTLNQDRDVRNSVAQEPVLLDSPDELGPAIAHLRTVVLPGLEQQANSLVDVLARQNENIARLEADLDRVPTTERIAVIQNEVNRTRAEHAAKLTELAGLRIRKEVLAKQRAGIDSQLDQAGEHEFSASIEVDDRARMLKHSAKVRETLSAFRTRVVQRHTSNIESLMLESFQKLLRKTALVTDLVIDPVTFEPTLSGRDSKTLPFDRLSAGERQLLATSMLWGLARASGRPIPTIIDTPLGRLDSAHRLHLVKRYFPNAAHQVILLSTDEEIVGDYLAEIEPFVARKYLLDHDLKTGRTSIEKGYFS